MGGEGRKEGTIIARGVVKRGETRKKE